MYDDELDISNGSVPSTSTFGPECKKAKPRNSRDQTEDKKNPESGNWDHKVHIYYNVLNQPAHLIVLCAESNVIIRCHHCIMEVYSPKKDVCG